jgi:hypothetical protein
MSARPSGRSASCSTTWQSSRLRARCHDGTGSMLANVRPPGATTEARLSTRRHVARGLPTYPRYESVSAPSVTRRHGKDDRGQDTDHGYHLHRGRCYDANEDRSPSPPPLGPQAFARHILHALFPQRYRTPADVLKYFGESNPRSLA